ncbi:T-complex protein 1 subunit eta [Hordeum vulgare]|nr:T-complex protein 1 subunit eta [Hordeum vulgare]
MDKLIHDDKGTTISNDGATISNDGATIMRLLDIMQPATKILIDIAKSQDSKAPAQKSMGARDKRSIILSLSNSEAEDNDRYKDDHKCSHLIAEALDPSGNISSAQISRKLTQLGLMNITRRTKVPEASLSAQGLVAQPQNDMLDDPKPESTRKMEHSIWHIKDVKTSAYNALSTF